MTRHDFAGGGTRLTRAATLRPGIFILLALLSGACTSQRPVLYPNDHYNRVGPSAAQHDISACIRLAKQAGADQGGSADAGKRAAQSAAVGGAAGAGYGAVRGDIGSSAGAGAAAAGAGSLMRSALDSGEASPMFRGYVDRCLRERGYDPIGWR